MSLRSLPIKLIRTSTRTFPKPIISIARRPLSSTPIFQRKDPNMSTQPPKHEMVYFPNMNNVASSSGEFRKVLHTGLYSQLVLMTVPVGGDVGNEAHTVDQILLFTSGQAKGNINRKDQDIEAGDLVVVPAGTQHQFVNRGTVPLILYTIYAPAEHNPQTVHHTKAEAEKEEAEGRDEPPAWSRRTMQENEEAGLVHKSGKY